jgi:multiple sugar transport system ATP-binding protein
LLVEALGAESLAHVEVSATPLDRPELVDVSASQAHLLPVADRTATLLARLEHDTGVRPGHVVDLAVDARRLHFFDLESGSAIPLAGTPVTAAVG